MAALLSLNTKSNETILRPKSQEGKPAVGSIALKGKSSTRSIRQAVVLAAAQVCSIFLEVGTPGREASEDGESRAVSS